VKHPKFAISALALSAVGFVGLIVDEGYTDTAVIPVKGDVPTYGFGSTTKEDGKPVRMGDTTTPVRAVKRSLAYIQADERKLKSCVTADLSQAEYDLYVNFGYQYGMGRICGDIARHLNAGRYYDACATLLQFRYVKGFDCATPGNKICRGVWTRQLERHAACYDAQS
jgi:GH24 family phage-related lysozyme (muramidase)